MKLSLTKQNQKVWPVLYNGRDGITSTMQSYHHGIFDQHFFSKYSKGDTLVIIGKLGETDFVTAFVAEYISPVTDTLVEGTKVWGHAPSKLQTSNGSPTHHNMQVLTTPLPFRMKLNGVQGGTIKLVDRSKLYARIEKEWKKEWSNKS